MGSEPVYIKSIWNYFGKDFMDNHINDHFHWRKYVEDLDMGLKLYKDYDFNYWDTYVITDPKKWMLAKIKYGI